MADQKTMMREMLANAVHFGHKTSKWNPKMSPYLYGEKNGVHIFDLNKSYQGLQSALEFLSAARKQGKTVLLVSTKQQSTGLLKEVAESVGMPYVTSKWIPGLLTNFKTVRTRVKFLQKLRGERENGDFSKYTKKEVVGFEKTIVKLEEALGGVESLEKLPDVVFVLDVCRDKIAIKEAKKVGATVVAVVDSNGDPSNVDYVIPGNDDALKSIRFLLTAVGDSLKA